MTNQEGSATTPINQQDNGKSSIVKGSAWMTIGSMLSRLLGAVYIIPWYAWMAPNSEMANSLFGKGYNIYALFLMIATAGIPAAVAKQISKYNALNEYKLSDILFKRSLLLMGGFGILFAGVMYVAAPTLAQGDMDLVPTMRALSSAVLIFPCMSVIRGFFQGNQNMVPSAISQVIEQLVRVFYMLLMTFIIMKVMQGSYVEAVTQSTFAAFIGMLGSLAVLLYFYVKYTPERRRLIEQSNNELKISTWSLLLEMLRESIPFIIVGVINPLFKLVDQYTFEPMMHQVTTYSSVRLKEMFSLITVNPDKLTMIIISIATSLAAASLPVITSYYIRKNLKGLGELTSDNIQLFALVMFPATMGMSVLAQPIYTLFYGNSVLGSAVLVAYTLSSLAYGFSAITSAMLQGMFQNRKLLLQLAVGFIVKLIMQYPCIYLFKIYGPIVATTIGYLVVDLMMIHTLHKISPFDKKHLAKRLLMILGMSLLMTLTTWLVSSGLGLFLNPGRRIPATIMTFISVGFGVAVYGYFVLKTRLADELIGERIGKLRKIFHIK